MGSVIDTIECENCSNDAYEEVYYKSGEFYVFCDSCGYSHRAFFERDEDGELVLKNEEEGKVFENLTMKEEKIENPWGAYNIKNNNGIGQTGTIYDEAESIRFSSHIDELVSTDEHEILYVILKRYLHSEKKHIEIPVYKRNENVIIE